MCQSSMAHRISGLAGCTCGCCGCGCGPGFRRFFSTEEEREYLENYRDQLKKELAGEKRPIRLVGIGVSHLVEAGGQLDMLDSATQRQQRLNRAIDRIRKKYGFSAIQTGRTLLLKDISPATDDGYTLHTPSLSR